MMHRHRQKTGPDMLKQLIEQCEQGIASIESIEAKDRSSDEKVKLTDLRNKMDDFNRRLMRAQKNS